MYKVVVRYGDSVIDEFVEADIDYFDMLDNVKREIYIDVEEIKKNNNEVTTA